MSSPESPIPIGVRPRATALVVSDDSLIVYRHETESEDSDTEWIKVRHEDHDALDTLSLKDASINPPIYGEFQVSVCIDSPVTSIFEYVADIRTHPEYADFVDSVEILSDSKVGENVVFNQTHKGSTECIESEFELYEPTDHIGWVTRKDAGDIHIRYWFEQLDNGTQVTHAGITPLHHDSQGAFASDLNKLRQRYKNNVEEMWNLRSILE